MLPTHLAAGVPTTSARAVVSSGLTTDWCYINFTSFAQDGGGTFCYPWFVPGTAMIGNYLNTFELDTVGVTGSHTGNYRVRCTPRGRYRVYAHFVLSESFDGSQSYSLFPLLYDGGDIEGGGPNVSAGYPPQLSYGPADFFVSDDFIGPNGSHPLFVKPAFSVSPGLGLGGAVSCELLIVFIQQPLP